jgi:hypothetical protein
VPVVFLEITLENGCKYLNLNRATLNKYPINSWEFPKTCQLKYLDMSLCDYYLNEVVLEELLKSCHSLEKLSVRCELNHDTGQLFSDSVFYCFCLNTNDRCKS